MEPSGEAYLILLGNFFVWMDMCTCCLGPSVFMFSDSKITAIPDVFTMFVVNSACMNCFFQELAMADGPVQGGHVKFLHGIMFSYVYSRCKINFDRYFSFPVTKCSKIFWVL